MTNAFLFFCDDIKENETSCFFPCHFISFFPYEFQLFLLGKLTSHVSYILYLKKMKSHDFGLGVGWSDSSVMLQFGRYFFFFFGFFFLGGVLGRRGEVCLRDEYGILLKYDSYCCGEV